MYKNLETMTKAKQAYQLEQSIKEMKSKIRTEQAESEQARVRKIYQTFSGKINNPLDNPTSVVPKSQEELVMGDLLAEKSSLENKIMGIRSKVADIVGLDPTSTAKVDKAELMRKLSKEDEAFMIGLEEMMPQLLARHDEIQAEIDRLMVHVPVWTPEMFYNSPIKQVTVEKSKDDKLAPRNFQRALSEGKIVDYGKPYQRSVVPYDVSRDTKQFGPRGRLYYYYKYKAPKEAKSMIQLALQSNC
jgi:hypothetical protein